MLKKSHSTKSKAERLIEECFRLNTLIINSLYIFQAPW